MDDLDEYAVYQRKKVEKGTGDLKPGRVWYVDFRDGNGKRRRLSLDTANERVAHRKAREVVERERRCPTHRAKPTELLEQYVADLRRQNLDDEHVKIVEARVRRVLERVQVLGELTPERIGELLAELAESAPPTPRRPQGGVGPRTQNHYRKALCAFFAWLVDDGRWPKNPVLRVAEAKVRGPERERAAFTDVELTTLVDAPTTARWRAACYLLAASVGLRREELAAVLEADVDLDQATLFVRARATKDSQDAVLVLSPWAVEVLRDYLRATPPEKRPDGRTPARGPLLFPTVPTTRRLGLDMKAAGLGPRERADGSWIDFHSLRATYATWLARKGVPLQLAQRLLRHKDPKLTSNVYTKLVLHDARAAAELLRPARAEAEPARNRA